MGDEIRFDGWSFRKDSVELTKNGTKIRLQKQSLQVLGALLDHPGEALSREHLIALLWPKGIVEFDTALNTIMRRLRRALGDDAVTPRYIETLPRYGYRFIGSLERGRADSQPLSSSAHTDFATSRPELRPAARGAPLWAALTVAVGLLSQDGGHRTYDVGETPANSSHPAAQLALGRRAPSNARAAEQYSQARYFLQRRASGDLDRAHDHFEQALLLDPNFAEASAGLATVYWLLLTEDGIPRELGAARLKSAAERALEIDPNSSEAHQRMLNYTYWMSQSARAEDLNGARELDPNSVFALSSRSDRAVREGRLGEAVEFARRAAAAEPLSIVYRYNLACVLLVAGRYEEAKQVNFEVLEINPGYHAEAAAQAMILQGEAEQALQLVTTWPASSERLEVLALAYHALRRDREADAALADLVETDRDRDPVRIAEVYAFRGESTEAFRWLDIASHMFRDRQARILSANSPDTARFSPFLKSLREEPRWEEWLASAPGIER